MEWNILLNEKDIKLFMVKFGNFHDACIKELSFSTGVCVDDKLSMRRYGIPTATILFQRQWKNPVVVELKFESVEKLNIVPIPENYSPEMYGATFIFRDSLFYWAENDGWDIESSVRDNCTWISAKHVQWRIRDDLIGFEQVYVEQK